MYGEEKVLEMRQWTKPQSAVILGLSGGGDSVYLLHALYELRKEQPFDLLAVHIHHGLRGEAADEDERFSKALCEKLRIPFLSEHIDVKTRAKERGMTLEQSGREARYEVFYREAKRVLEENPACEEVNIFLAHHANDQEETVLMNLLRGSGPAGLSGMQPCTEAFLMDGRPVRLIRPLLFMTHEMLLSSLRQRGLLWREDATNQEPDYTRNKLRGEILPALKELSPGFTRICGREAVLFSELADYMECEAGRVLMQHMQRQGGLVLFPVKELAALHPALMHTVIRKCIDQACGLKDVSTAHVDAVEALLRMQSGRRTDLPGGLVVCREFDYLCFKMDTIRQDRQPETVLFWEVNAANGVEFLKNLEKYRSERYTKWFDYDKIVKYCGEGAPVLRKPEEGDYLLINRQGQRKRLALYLKQEKIPERLRSEIQVVAWGDVILWVPGYRDSVYFFITDETEKILRLQISQEK